MISFSFVMNLGPFQQLLDRSSILEVSVWYKWLLVSWNVQPIQLLQLLGKLLFSLSIIDRNNSCTSSFKEFDMWLLDKHAFWEDIIDFRVRKEFQHFLKFLFFMSCEFLLPQWTITVFRLRNRLHHNSNNGRICFCSNVMTSSNHRRICHFLIFTLWVLLMFFTIWKNYKEVLKNE